jgi:hypothetical protein
MKVQALALSSVLIVGTAGLASAQTSTDLNNEATKMNTLASSQGDGKVIGKMSGDFNSFLGSDSNAVVTGLRNGTPITLTRTTTTPSATPGGLPVTTTNTTVITPPTGQMGHGNVYISLALAKQQLNTMGINEPTPQQLQAALTGGSITQTYGAGAAATTRTTQLRGILTMRSEKMGWGKIAQELGTKLGPVMSSMKSANQKLADGTHPSSNGSGVANGSGQTKQASSATVSGSGKANANSSHGQSTGKASGSGIVTASGRGAGGNAYGRSGGIVTGSGHGAGSTGGGAAQGGSENGAGHGKGQSK